MKFEKNLIALLRVLELAKNADNEELAILSTRFCVNFNLSVFLIFGIFFLVDLSHVLITLTVKLTQK